MRLHLIPVCLLLCTAFTLMSCDDDHDIPPDKVPTRVQQAYEQQVPNATPFDREKGNGLYKAEFYKDGHEGEAWFQPDGTWVRTETDVRIAELPQAVTDYVATYYPTHHIDDTNWVETPAQSYYALELEKNGMRDKHISILPDGEPLS